MLSSPPKESLIRLPEVKRRTGISTTEIYRQMAQGRFPRQRKLSHKVVVWVESQIDAWVMKQLAADLRELLG